MHIVLHCGGMPFDGNTIEQSSLGGSETAAYYMAKEIATLGHTVILFTNCSEPTEKDGVNYIPSGQITERAPLGEDFTYYAKNTPSDMLIIQRHPLAFREQWASKVNILWLHDLALYSSKDYYIHQLQNIDKILTVSEYHKDQVAEVWGIDKDIILPITNGIDLSLYEGEINIVETDHDQGGATAAGLIDLSDDKKLLYSSRPERGLEHLVAEDGIMERLDKLDPSYHLYVCSYDNVTEAMAGYYNYLTQRCNELPNVTLLGSLSKPELADVMRQCDAMVYPTPGPQQSGFEEVSCITAMECMAAGLPFISTVAGALPETCGWNVTGKNDGDMSGCILLDLNDDGMPDIQNFVDTIHDNYNLFDGSDSELKEQQLSYAKRYDWKYPAEKVLGVFTEVANKYSDAAKLRHLIDTSDYYAAKKLAWELEAYPDTTSNRIYQKYLEELDECYAFTKEKSWDKHYEDYYQYEKERGVNYGPEDVTNTPRFMYVDNYISDLPDLSDVLDYGCAHGHFTVALAKKYPNLRFVGIDITESNIETARKWAEKEGLTNIEFQVGRVDSDRGEIKTEPCEGYKIQNKLEFDFIIAAEVIEHLEDYKGTVDTLCSYLNEGGKFLATTPFGQWEAQGYKEHWPWRAHVHHFERSDLKEAFGHHPNYKLVNIPAGNLGNGWVIGSYGWSFSKPVGVSCNIDYVRKLEECIPSRETISLCMIVKDAEDSILRCIKSVAPNVDEFCFAVDRTTTDDTVAVIKKYLSDSWPEKAASIIDIESPLKTGFDAARNKSIEMASGDWILWLDADEEIVWDNRVWKYLHNNTCNGYALKQHHFSVQPLGVMKTDLPIRIFRSNKGIKFHGVVHEHPERAVNEGVGPAAVIPEVDITHHGYTNEAVRRGRFDRNLDLMFRDRKENPDRNLGKLLWLRDLTQMNQREMEINGGRITPDIMERTDLGIEMFAELLESKELRLIIEGIQFYSTLSQIKGNSFEFGVSLKASKLNGGLHMEDAPVVGWFHDVDFAKKLNELIFEEEVKNYESRYYQ